MDFKDEYFDTFTHDYYEYEQGQKHIIVKGRLKLNIQFWEDIGASHYVIDILMNGYKIPFHSKPVCCFMRNNKSALEESEFVSEAIHDLLARSLVVKCDKPPFVVNPLTVSIQANGKKRLILDLREVNKHLWKQSVKYDDLRIALSYLSKQCWQIKFDICSAYHHIDIFMPHTEYLGFCWENGNGSVIYYKFLVLPFGISTAPYVYTKVCRPLIAKWRGEGKLVLMFLDDGYGCGKDYHSTLNMACDIKQDLLKSGFVPKAGKCVWTPVQSLQFLGAEINSENGIVRISDTRIQKIKSTIESINLCLKQHRRVRVRLVASLVGQIISMGIVIGLNVCQIMTRYLSADILTAFSWNSCTTLSPESLEQIQFWENHLNLVNAKNIFESHKCSKIVYSDASKTGFGGFEVGTVNGISHGMWAPDEQVKSSTWRELTAVFRVLSALIHLLSNQKVKWFSDNAGVTTIVQKGSMKLELQAIAIDIFKLCMSQSVSLEIEWIPRSENEKADYCSKIVEKDDWGISFSILSSIIQKWGDLQVDWFASGHNAKLPVFFSRFWNPGSAGVDAFAQSWGSVCGLFVPPICIIHQVIKKMHVEGASGVLIVPCWKSAAFWPLLCPDGQLIGNVSDWYDLPTEKQFYTPCKNGIGMFGNEDLKFRMLALKISFK